MTLDQQARAISQAWEEVLVDSELERLHGQIMKALQSQADEIAKLKRQLEVAVNGLGFIAGQDSLRFTESFLRKSAKQHLAEIERIGEGR